MNIIIALSAFSASLLTFYSGFGLGTLLMPILALFVPIETAIAITALVHLLHNALKSIALWNAIDWKLALQFGAIAVLAAIPGAWALKLLSTLPPITQYTLAGHTVSLSWVGVIVGLILLGIAIHESLVRKKGLLKNVYLLGAASGFLGGLSGNQGAFRSAFLIQLKKNARGFVATGAIIAAFVDIVRVLIYWTTFFSTQFAEHSKILLTAAVSAAAAVFLGTTLLSKMTIRLMRWIVIGLLYLLSILMISGLL